MKLRNKASTLSVLLGSAAALTFAAGAVLAADAPADASAQSAGSADDGQIHAQHVQGNIWLMAGEPGMSNVAAQIAHEGVLVVDTGTRAMADKLLERIKQVANEHADEDGVPEIRWIIDTDSGVDHIGGNDVIARGGRTIVAGNFTRDAQSQGLQNAATIMANTNLLAHLVAYNAQASQDQQVTLPENAVDADIYNTSFDGEAVQLYHPHAAVSDDDTMVVFRRSDVIATGDVIDMTSYPHIDLARGGSIDGELVALNKIIELAVPEDKQQGGTMIIPGHGRLCDQADVVHYKNVLTIIRNRVQFYKNQGKSLQQVLAIKPSQDYDLRWGSNAQDFVQAVYKTLPAKGPSFSMQNETVVPADTKVSGKVF
jgi:glyoxylase-like metal-dependent hydrolase (beta-lactamase superfamily II)